MISSLDLANKYFKDTVKKLIALILQKYFLKYIKYKIGRLNIQINKDY